MNSLSTQRRAMPPRSSTVPLSTTRRDLPFLVLFFSAVVSALVLAVALNVPILPALHVLLSHFTILVSTARQNVLFFAWVGAYFLIIRTAVVTGQWWVLDMLGGRTGQMCGNKFVECRPWG